MDKHNKHTKDFYGEYFTLTYEQLNNASHWVSEDGKETVKLVSALKAVYHHKLAMYKSFTKKGMIYKESHKTVAETISIDFDMVRRVYVPLLKKMGLIEIVIISPRNSYTLMYPLKDIKGSLINNNLKDKNKLKPLKNSTITHEEFKTIEKNKQKIERMKKDLKTEYFILTKEELDRFRQLYSGDK